MPYVYGMDQFPSALAAAALVDGQHFTIPGYGTLEGVYVSAQINHVEREVAPPRLEVTWETTPVPGAQTFAELLVNTGATNAEAIDAQDAWLDALERGERITVGDLGTLELDGVTNLARWTPNREALDRAYWSSGSVPVEPLSAGPVETATEGAAVPTGASDAAAKTAPLAVATNTAQAPVIHTRADEVHDNERNDQSPQASAHWPEELAAQSGALPACHISPRVHRVGC